jgi:hypothetical protein
MVCVGVGVRVTAGVAVTVEVDVGVRVGVGVRVPVGGWVRVGVGVEVGVPVDTGVRVGVRVRVGEWVRVGVPGRLETASGAWPFKAGARSSRWPARLVAQAVSGAATRRTPGIGNRLKRKIDQAPRVAMWHSWSVV